MEEKIKVVWLCHFANEIVNNILNLKFSLIEYAIRLILHKRLDPKIPEYAVWVTNGIKEFEKIEDIELHIISPYPHLTPTFQEFQRNGIYYHFFLSEDCSIYNQIYQRILKKRKVNNFFKNREIISNLIKKISPDLVHLIGAETPSYSLALLDIPENIPTIVQLQTLMSDPNFYNNYPIDKKEYQYRSSIESEIIKNANYIGTRAKKYRSIIQEKINPNAIFLNITLPLTEEIHKEYVEKKYDFVYFAANIAKAADLALEAFGIAYLQNPRITLDVIGSYDSDTKQRLDSIITHYGMSNAISFEGNLSTHDDVLKQIRKARYALLPLRIDLTSGTIREAMANGLPVLTTDTGELGTQKLNLTRQNVLISSIGDHQALANNMIKILADEKLADTLRQNSYQATLERNSNEAIVLKYVKAYRACINNFINGIPFPKDLIEI